MSCSKRLTAALFGDMDSSSSDQRDDEDNITTETKKNSSDSEDETEEVDTEVNDETEENDPKDENETEENDSDEFDEEDVALSRRKIKRRRILDETSNSEDEECQLIWSPITAPRSQSIGLSCPRPRRVIRDIQACRGKEDGRKSYPRRQRKASMLVYQRIMMQKEREDRARPFSWCSDDLDESDKERDLQSNEDTEPALSAQSSDGKALQTRGTQGKAASHRRKEGEPELQSKKRKRKHWSLSKEGNKKKERNGSSDFSQEQLTSRSGGNKTKENEEKKRKVSHCNDKKGEADREKSSASSETGRKKTAEESRSYRKIHSSWSVTFVHAVSVKTNKSSATHLLQIGK